MSDEKKPVVEFEEEPQKPITAALQSTPGVGTPANTPLKRSYFEDDIITPDTYTTTLMLGDIKCFVREFTGDERARYRSAARLAAVAMGLPAHLVDDAEALIAALGKVPVDDNGNNGIDQFSAHMADTLNAVVVEHLKGWDLPADIGNRPCTRENKLKLHASNKFEFCNTLNQLAGLSQQDATTLKNS